MSGRARTDRTIERARNAFIAALMDGASVTLACEKASIPRSTAYDWRTADGEFRAVWDDALEAGTDKLEDEAYRRAREGVNEPVVAMGKIARNEDGSMLLVRKYSDALMQFLLKGRRPDKFRERVSTEHSGPGGGPIETKDVSARDRIAGRIAGLATRGRADGGIGQPE